MKNYFILILFFFNVIILNGQNVPSVGSYNIVTGASICQSNNGFGIRSLNPISLHNQQWPANFDISLEIFVATNLSGTYNPLPIPYPWPGSTFPGCIPGGPAGTNPVRLDNASLTSTGCTSLAPLWTAGSNSYVWNVSCTGNTATININYSVFLDCSLLDLIANGSMFIVEKWYYNGIPLPAWQQNLIPVPVSYPHIIPIVPSQQYVVMDAPNGQTAQWIFFYKNNGNTAANISFTFDIDACSSYDLTDKYWITQSSNVPPFTWPTVPNYPNGTSVSIPPGDYLIIRQDADITGCASDCDPIYADFTWKCNDNGNVCATCQEDYETQIVFTPGIESFTVTRALNTPTYSTALENTACQGTSTPWKIQVTNTGNSVLSSINIDLKNAPGIQNPLSMINGSPGAITISATGGFSGAVLNPHIFISPIPTPLGDCSSIPSPVDKFSVTITNLPPGIIVDINFTEYHCCSEDDILLNANKIFNQWNITSSCTTACGNIIPRNIPLNPTDDAVVTAPKGISGYSPAPDLNLVLGYTPMVTHITVSKQSTSPYYALTPVYFRMYMDGLFADSHDEQALGFSAAQSTPVSGIIKVEIECEPGLGIMNFNDVFFEFPVVGGPAIRFDPELNPINNYNCTLETYTFYFKISNSPVLPAELLFTDAVLVFGLTACCPTQAVSDYSVKFSLLRNESCFSFANGVCTPNLGATCCWLPLSKKGKFVNVHCPGCLAPGTIVDSYQIFRTSLGFEDVDNNRRKDNNNRIDFYPGQTAIQSPYVAYPLLNLEQSVYGDSLEDYTIAHFEDGSSVMIAKLI